jgi:hypothetical protein
MKTIFKSTVLLAAVGMSLFTSCKDDNDSNPTLTQPTQFVLNTPAVTGSIDLEKSQTVALSWSQPTPYNDFNAPVVPTYSVQLSPTASFTKAFDINAEDNTGADFVTLDETYSSGKNVEIVTSTINRALMQLKGWEADDVPATLDLAIRVKSAVRDASFNEYGVIYSNVVTLKTVPYYMELNAADPEIWWLIGGDIADGSWGGDYGKCVIPMQTVDGADYDKKTGQGEIRWTGYLSGNGFKLRGSMEDNWATQWGQGDAFGSYKKNDGGSGNITVPEAGLYTVTLNTAKDELTVEKYDGTATVFAGMALAGSFNDWGDEPMLPCSTGWENHDWYAIVDFAADTEWKVKEAGSWDYNKGGTFINRADGMYVYGVSNGDNLKMTESGKYLILFNDITGYIRVIKQ